MGPVIGEILPLAVGIAISPIPIVAVILMLLSPRAKSTSVGFMIGWVVGIIVAVVVFTLGAFAVWAYALSWALKQPKYRWLPHMGAGACDTVLVHRRVAGHSAR